MERDLIRLEDGRVIDISPLERGEGLLELVDGSWQKPAQPVTIDMLYGGTPIDQA